MIKWIKDLFKLKEHKPNEFYNKVIDNANNMSPEEVNQILNEHRQVARETIEIAKEVCKPRTIKIIGNNNVKKQTEALTARRISSRASKASKKTSKAKRSTNKTARKRTRIQSK